MSRLQHLVNSLITVITGYNEIHTKNKYSLDAMLSQPSAELEQTLFAIINEATTNRSYDRRRPLFDYFLYVIKEVKPLVDKPEPLDSESYQTVHKLLTNLIDDVKSLLKTVQTDTVTVHYDNKEFKIIGSLYGGWAGGFCQSGSVLNRWIKSPDIFPLEEFSSAAFVTANMEQHQAIAGYPLYKARVDELNIELENIRLLNARKLEEAQKIERQLTESLETAKGNISELEASRNKIQEELAQLQSALARTKEQLTESEAKLSQSQNQSESALTQTKDELAQVKKELAQSNSERGQAQLLLIQSQLILAQTKDELAAVKIAQSSLEEEIAQLKEANRLLEEARVTQMRQRIIMPAIYGNLYGLNSSFPFFPKVDAPLTPDTTPTKKPGEGINETESRTSNDYYTT